MWLKCASIVVRVVILVFELLGIYADFSETMEETITKTEKAMRRSSVFQKAMREFLEAWEQPGASNMTKGVAILNLIWNMNGEGFLTIIVQSLCSKMTMWDYAKASVTVSAMTIAVFGSWGVALPVRLGLAAASAVPLVKDINAVLRLCSL